MADTRDRPARTSVGGLRKVSYMCISVDAGHQFLSMPDQDSALRRVLWDSRYLAIDNGAVEACNSFYYTHLEQFSLIC
jgi:hypothetical protein